MVQPHRPWPNHFLGHLFLCVYIYIYYIYTCICIHESGRVCVEYRYVVYGIHVRAVCVCTPTARRATRHWSLVKSTVCACVNGSNC